MIAAAVALLASAAPPSPSPSPSPLACGAATRPGIAERGADGIWRGRAVDLCRAIAGRIGGAGAPIVFHSYDAHDGLAAAVHDRIAFVSPAERAAVPALHDGTTIAVDRQVLAVRAASRLASMTDLDHRLVCFIVGTRAEDALDAWAARAGVAIERLGFQEPDEMQDAVDVGKCAAEAVDAAQVDGSEDRRLLGTPLAAEPIAAATPASAAERWRAVVADAARGSDRP